MNDLILMRVLQCADGADGNIGRSGMLKLLLGQHSRKFAKCGLDHLPEFGSLSHIDKSEILTHIDYMIERGCLQIGTLLFPMIQITDTGKTRLSRMIPDVKAESLVAVVKQPEPQIELDKVHVCNEVGFWKLFPKDLRMASRSVVIFSPFISKRRVAALRNDFKSLLNRNIMVTVYIRPISDNERTALDMLKNLGIFIAYRKMGHHKVAIIDDAIAWEGSLNILQHWKSTEHMTRHNDPEYTKKLYRVVME